MKVHPLFWALGVYYAIKGELFLFFISTLVALQHELAHAFTAERLGYRLRRVVLMPYGAVLDGDLSGCSLKDEIAVALAGPICNFLTSALFVASWWIRPTLYPYTDTACYISFWTGVVNLIPAYPLDGGRVFSALLFRAVGEKKGEKIRKATSVAVVVALALLFLEECRRGVFSLGLLLFCVFLGAGLFGGGGDARYEKIVFSAQDSFARGVEMKRVAVADSFLLRKTTRFLEKGKFLVLEIWSSDERKLGELTQNQLSELFIIADYDAKIGDFL